jgi:glucan biosynthesis protein C
MSSSTVERTRFHSLDAVRAAAMLAGIVLHATMSYLPGFGALNWAIADKSTSTTLGLAYFVIHIFRMALFFMVAGFFARLLRQRLGTRGLIKNRLRRIGLPLLASMVLIIPLVIGAQVWGAAQLGVREGPPPTAVAPVIGPPVLLGHLWFLYLLLVLLALWLPVRAVFARLDTSGAWRAALAAMVARVIASRVAPVLLAVPVTSVLLSARWWLVWMGIPPPTTGLVPNLPAVLSFGCAFVLGWVMHREQRALRSMEAD